MWLFDKWPGHITTLKVNEYKCYLIWTVINGQRQYKCLQKLTFPRARGACDQDQAARGFRELVKQGREVQRGARDVIANGYEIDDVAAGMERFYLELAAKSPRGMGLLEGHNARS